MKPATARMGITGALGLLAVVAIFLGAEQESGEAVEFASPATLLNQEPGFQAQENEDNAPSMDDTTDWGSGDASLEPLTVENAENFSIGIYSDTGYPDSQGRYVIDLLEQDYAYLTVIVTDLSGRPIVGAKPSFKLEGGSELLPPEEVASRSVTDSSGTLDFAIIGGTMALDQVTVSVGDATQKLIVNVISLEASGYPTPPEVDGGIPWSELMKARIRYLEDSVSVTFAESVRAQNDKVAKLSGFMMPLEPDVLQRRFLLTSNPPSCFFHIPGGPAGAVEVLAPEGVEASWDPIVVEGHFKLLESDEYGVIYRLEDAKLSQP